MKYILLLLFTIYTTSFANTYEQINNKLEKQVEDFYPLVELSLVQRSQSKEFLNALESELDTTGHLCAESVHTIKKETAIQQELRAELRSRALMYEPWLKDESLDPKLRLKGVMFSLSSAIILYDNYLLNISMFQKHSHLRNIINMKDNEYGLDSRELLIASKEYTSIVNYLRMKKTINFYNKSLNKKVEFDEQMLYLQALIEKSPSYRALMDKNFFQIIQQKLSFYGRVSLDEFGLLTNNSVNLVSEVFGNSVGLVATRTGHMYNNPELQKEITSTLRAGDILLEKTPFRLTDKFIPGYWGHAAIWVGTKAELQELGLWNNPTVIPHHQEIEKGNFIIEAVRSGVVLSSLEHFLNIDDMAVLRENQEKDTSRKAIILRAFAQLGKKYDFNFDVESTDKIVCSELVYTSYTHIKWPTSKALGRYTVSPDHIAQKTQTKELELVSLFYAGKEVKQPQELWTKMLKDEL